MRRRLFCMMVVMIGMLAVISDAEAKKGFYMSLGASYNSIQGDFDGTKGLEGDSDVIILPDIDNAVGIDIRGGYGINDQWAIEAELMSSQHDGTFERLTGDVGYLSFGVNAKYSFRSTQTVQPYLLAGISSNVLVIDKGAADISTGEVDDATLSGIGFNFGAGVDNYFNEHISLTFGVTYRFVDYTTAEGVHEDGAIDDGVDGSGFGVLLSTAFHF